MYKVRSGTYYGKRVGSQIPPSTLSRQGTVHQHARSGSTTVIKFTKKVTVPTQAYSWSERACTKTTEQMDGFGLPGAPGSHKCCAATIPDESENKLG